MTRDEFYERFPWIINLPEHPQCCECFLIQNAYVFENDQMTFSEVHREGCSRARYSGTVRVVEPETALGYALEDPCAE